LATAGQSAFFRLVLAIAAGAAQNSTITNTAQVSTTTAGSNPNNESSSATSTVATSADLQVTKTGPAIVTPDTTATYTITATNAGPSDAQSVSLTDTVTTGSTVQSMTEPTGPTFTCSPPAGNSGTCTIATLGAGQSAVFQVTVVIDANLPSSGSVLNTASFNSITPDPNHTNNSASVLSPNSLGVLVVSGTTGNDHLVVNATGTDSGSYTLNAGSAVPFSGISQFVFNGLGGNDTFTINNTADLLLAPSGGILFNNPGTSRDVLEDLGGPATTGTFTPGSTPDAGTLVHTGSAVTQTIGATGLAQVNDTVADGTSFTVFGTSAADQFQVGLGPLAAGVPTAAVSSPSFATVNAGNKAALIVAGTGNDTYAVTATLAGTPTTIQSGGGSDLVTVGDALNTLGGIAGPLDVAGGGSTTLNVNDQGNAAATTYTVSDTAVTSSAGPAITYSALANLTLNGGTGGNTYTVTATAGGTTTTVFTGGGGDAIAVQATGSGSTTDIVGGLAGGTSPAGNDTVTITNAGSVQGILGNVNVENPVGTDTITVDDSADTAAQAVFLDSLAPNSSDSEGNSDTYGTIDGLAPAEIAYEAPDTNNVTIDGGSGANTYQVAFTIPFGTTTVNAGTGSDTFTIFGGSLGATSTNNFTGQGGNDVFNVFGPTTSDATTNVNGGTGSSALNYNAGGGNVTITPSGPGSGTVTQPGGGTVNYTKLPSVNITPSGALVTIADTTGGEQLTVTASDHTSGSYALTSGATTIVSGTFGGIASLAFDAPAGGDTFTIDNPSGGLFAPAGGIAFNAALGDVGGNTLEDLGGAADSGNFTPNLTATPPNAGTVTHANATDTQTVTFTGLAAYTDTVSEPAFTVNGTDHADTIIYQDGTDVGATHLNTVTDSNAESVSFANKTAVSVAGDPNATGNADTYDVGSFVAATGLSALSFNGGPGNDTFNVMPSAAVPIAVSGGSQAAVPPGDSLTLVPSDCTGAFLTIAGADPTGGFDGGYTFADCGPVNFTSIETLSPSAVVVGVAKTDDTPGTAAPGTPVTYTVTVTNTGTLGVAPVTVNDPLPPQIDQAGASWTCTASPGSSCANAGGTGSISGEADALAAGGTVSYTITAPILSSATGTMTNTATITTPPGVTNTGAITSTDVITLTPQAGLAITKSGPSTVTAGNTLTYTLSVTNAGPSDAQAVKVTDTVPTGTTFGSLTPPPGFTCNNLPAAGGTGTFTCSDPTLAAGASAVFTLVVNAPSSDADGSTVANTATATSTTPGSSPASSTVDTTVRAVADVSVVKTAPATVTAGTDMTYAITLSNAGPSDALGVTLNDVLPANTTFVSEAQVPATPAFTCNAPPAGGTLTCGPATLPAGSSVVLSVVVAVAASAPFNATIGNTATVTSTTHDSNPGDKSGTASTTVTTAADVSVTKTGPATLTAGVPATYTISLTNAGPSDAHSVVLGDALPAGLTITSASGTGIGCTNTATALTCGPATLAAGAAASVTVIVQPGTNLPNGSMETNTASVTTSTTNTSTETSSSITAKVLAQADVSVTKAGPPTVTAGDNVTYTITVSNAGPGDALGVMLTDTLPSGATLVSVTETPGGSPFACNATPGGGNFSCSATTLAGPPAPGGTGASAVFTVVAHVAASTPASATATFTNSAAVTASTTDTVPGNDTATSSAAVVTTAALTVSKTSPATATAGTDITYTLSVTNAGPSDAQTVALADAVPANTTFGSEKQTGGTTAFSCTNPGTPTCTAATLPAGGSAVFQIVFHDGAATPNNTTITNTATLTSATSAPSSSTATTNSVAASSVTLHKTGPATVTAGGSVTYTISVTNADPSDAQGVTVTDTLPGATSFGSATPAGPDGFACTNAGNAVTCTAATLPVGHADTITLVAAVASSAGNANPLVNTAAVATTTTNTNPSPGSSTEATVVSRTDLSVTKTGPATVPEGGNATYTIAVSNAGPGDAANVSLNDVLPVGTSFVSATALAGFTCSTPVVGAGGTVTCTAATLPAGASATFNLVVQLATIATTIQNAATVSSATTDVLLANNVAAVTSRVIFPPPPPGVGLTKQGAGTLELDADNTYEVQTTMDAGLLLVDGIQPRGPVVVNGGTLAGHGEVGDTLINPGGRLAPANDAAGTPTVFTVGGNLTLTPGASLDVRLDGFLRGIDYGTVQALGTVNLGGGTLNATFGFDPGVAGNFVILDPLGSGPVQGTFALIPEGGLLPGVQFGRCFTVTYRGGDGNDVVIGGVDANLEFVHALYTALGLPPDALLQQLATALDAGQITRPTAAMRVWESLAHRADIVHQFFTEFQFHGTAPGLTRKLVNELQGGKFKEGVVLEKFLTSPQFRRQYRGDKAFVRAIYEGIYRTPGALKLPAKFLRRFLGIVRQPNGRAKLIALLLSNDAIYQQALANSVALLFDPGFNLGTARAGLLAQMKTGAIDSEGLFVLFTTAPPYTQAFQQHFRVTCALAEMPM
jgi:uncharacterized repeat protein (TIGR01451 family)